MKRIILLAFLIIPWASVTLGGQEPTLGKKTALLLIDIQNFYFPAGKLPLVNPQKASLQAKKVLQRFREKKELVIHIRHLASSGAKIHKHVKPQKEEKVISKRFANSFRDTELLGFLRKNHVTHLVIVGMQTHMCLEAATRAAADLGFKCTVIHDACATRDLKFNNQVIPAEAVHNATLASLSRTYAKVIDTATFLKENK